MRRLQGEAQQHVAGRALGTPTLLAFQILEVVTPGWAMTRSAWPRLLMAMILACPLAGNQSAPGPT